MNYESMSRNEIETTLKVLTDDLYKISSSQDCLYRLLEAGDSEECIGLSKMLRDETDRLYRQTNTLTEVVFSKYRYMDTLVGMIENKEVKVEDN